MNREIYHSKQYDYPQPAPDNGMTIDEANFAMHLISNLYDESPESVERIKALTLCLTKTPERFWEEFFRLADPDPSLRERCDAFARSGAYLPSVAREQLLKLSQAVIQ